MNNKRAVIIGINNYFHPFSSLESCIHDAEEIAALLEMPEYGFYVKKILGENATKVEITKALHELVENPSDFSLFYFAGHGYHSPFGTFIVTADGKEYDYGLELDSIQKLLNLNKTNINSTLAILDCCHSGSATIGNNSTPISNTDLDSSFSKLNSGRVVLAACKADEKAYESHASRHGLFTKHLIDALLGDAATPEGEVTVTSLYEYIANEFHRAAKQSPVFKGDIIGKITIGNNLKPRSKTELPEQKIKQITGMATSLLNDYIKLTSTDMHTWMTSTYMEASSRLKPIMTWLSREESEHPELKKNPDFALARDSANNKLAELAHINTNYVTREGKIIARLGSGTFGTVWLLENNDGKQFAYKVYHPIDLANTDKLSRFTRGYRAMEQLDHPHIVKVHKYTECPIGFLMDFVEGSNLRDFASQQRSPSEILPQLLTVGETLKHTHSRNVIHRDVKPENIIMKWENNDFYRPYLTDFDLAWFSTATQFTREGLGSLIYAAPEQISQPNSKLSHAPTTDIYAFGQLIFFFICRRDPVIMLANNEHALGEELRLWRIEEPARKLIKLFMDCTHQDAKKRVQDFREVCDRLFEINALIETTDHKKPLSFIEFCKQLSFSIVGMAPERIRSDTSFLTTSGRTLIEISQPHRHNSTAISFRLEILANLFVDGASNFKEARETLNERISAVLRNFPNTSRKSGNQGIFETIITINEISLDIDGVEQCRPILMRIIDCIERS